MGSYINKPIDHVKVPGLEQKFGSADLQMTFSLDELTSEGSLDYK